VSEATAPRETTTPMSRVYVRVVAVEAAIIAALWIFSRLFT